MSPSSSSGSSFFSSFFPLAAAPAPPPPAAAAAGADKTKKMQHSESTAHGETQAGELEKGPPQGTAKATVPHPASHPAHTPRRPRCHRPVTVTTRPSQVGHAPAPPPPPPEPMLEIRSPILTFSMVEAKIAGQKGSISTPAAATIFLMASACATHQNEQPRCSVSSALRQSPSKPVKARRDEKRAHRDGHTLVVEDERGVRAREGRGITSLCAPGHASVSGRRSQRRRKPARAQACTTVATKAEKRRAPHAHGAAPA